MQRNKILILAIGILSFGNLAGAQSLRSDGGPAELPPASFKGKQYVDSKGCVYIKAGYGTRVTWVPRVNRSRKVFCNSRNKPSLSSSQLAAISGESTTRVITPTVRTAAAPEAAKPVAKKKKANIFGAGLFGSTRTKAAKPKKVVRTASKPVPTIQNTTPLARPAKHVSVKGIRFGPQSVHPADAIRDGGTQTIAQTTYTQPTTYTPVTTTYRRPERSKSVRGTSWAARRSNRLAIRTGPQAVHPADVIRAQDPNAGSYNTGTTNYAAAASRGVDAVHGHTIYPSVITSDVTARGDAQMAMVWTNTVPRRLIKKNRARQIASAAQYSASTKTPIIRKRARTSTKAVKSTARYVQIGTFGNPANVSKTAARFQSSGLPVRTRAIKNKGKNLKVVYLGPFSSADALLNALSTARSAGFKDAFYVR